MSDLATINTGPHTLVRRRFGVECVDCGGKWYGDAPRVAKECKPRSYEEIEASAKRYEARLAAAQERLKQWEREHPIGHGEFAPRPAESIHETVLRYVAAADAAAGLPLCDNPEVLP